MFQKWNAELAGIAQSWADQCKWSNNPDRSSDSDEFGYVGENKYIRTGRYSCINISSGLGKFIIFATER